MPLYTVWTCIFNVCTCIYNVCALYNQLSEQGLVAYTEMQMPLLGGLSVEKTGAKKAAAQKERLLRGAETHLRRKADWEWWEMKCSCEHAQTCLYSVHTYINIYVHICNMYIQRYKHMYMYVPCTYIRQNSCTCMYKYVYLCTCTSYVHTCLYMYILS